MAKNFEDFKRLYPLSKTLRFEAKPIGATLDNIVKSGLLDEDEHRAASYVKVKKLIDEYHKVFIDRVLDMYLSHKTKMLKKRLRKFSKIFALLSLKS